MTASVPSAASAPYEADFDAASTKYGLPPGLLREVARQESGFNPNSVSPTGATGLMQFEPATAAGLGVDPNDPASAIDGAGKYLAQLYQQFGSWDLALAGYNAGAGAVAKYGNTIPPYAETQDYVRNIFGKLGWTLGGAVPKATAKGTTGADVTSPSSSSGSASASSSSGASKLGGWDKVIVEAVVLIGGVGLVVAGIYQATTGRSAVGTAVTKSVQATKAAAKEAATDAAKAAAA